ncbi:hypothetical protein M7I_7218 [Glarea lozoyensis 74030]|uniref:Uncharacterized protein n=1 Tax=Glarea lozoyensis (strain ATCC 74030 / MF5533) TaxID=1104152 RepID=H0EWP6_GLAL7|nr:hypothetical protein M7I_7218 [Glarea lozoyensis 74030]
MGQDGAELKDEFKSAVQVPCLRMLESHFGVHKCFATIPLGKATIWSGTS